MTDSSRRRPWLPWGRQRPRAVGATIGFLAGLAAATFTTSLAAGVAGYQADRALHPLEVTMRVGLLVAAPCMGAILATLVLPRRGGPLPVWAISVGAAITPVFVLRLDRFLDFELYGWQPALVCLVALVIWVVACVALIRVAGTDGVRPVGVDPSRRATPRAGMPRVEEPAPSADAASPEAAASPSTSSPPGDDADRPAPREESEDPSAGVAS